MKYTHTIKINFRGGIISPGELYNILVAAGKAGVLQVRFGLRQQLLIETGPHGANLLRDELDKLRMDHECDSDDYPNIMSSYPAGEVFITNTWLSEGVYRDIFDLMDYQPRLKINVSDSNQSFTPLFTGNINWVASPSAQHFWHLFIRFPKSNAIYEWKDIVYTNDVARMSKQLEKLMIDNDGRFNDHDRPGDLLYEMLNRESYITKPAESALQLPTFNLPYYEGLNRYNDKYWLGIYRRDELFTLRFLKDICLLCLQTKIGQLCSTPWKSLIIKGIEGKYRQQWSHLLAKHQVNVRHAANELNFQVEDNCWDGLSLKQDLVKQLSKDDLRTFGICIGIKTRRKSEVFSTILVRRRPLLRIGHREFFHVYDILCAKDFNPNERTGFIFSKTNPRFILYEQLRRSILAFYEFQGRNTKQENNNKEQSSVAHKREYVYQCTHCLTVYDESVGEPEHDIAANTPVEQLPTSYTCPVCEASVDEFKKIEKDTLWLQAV